MKEINDWYRGEQRHKERIRDSKNVKGKSRRSCTRKWIYVLGYVRRGMKTE